MTQKLLINGLEVEATYSDTSVENVFLPLLKKIISLQEEKKRRILVFFSAPPATGKSTLLAVLPQIAKDFLGCGDMESVGIDGFHHYNEVLEEKNLKKVKGSFRTFDVEKLSCYLEKLTSQKEVSFPTYDRRLHNPVEDAIYLSKNIILVEGNYLSSPELNWQSLEKYCDYSVFISANGEDLKNRLVSRKIASGHSKKEAEDFYEASDRKNVDYVLNHRLTTDLVIHLNVETNEFTLQ